MINGPDNSFRDNGYVMCTICSYNNGYNYIPSVYQIYKDDSSICKTTIFTQNEISKFTQNEISKEDKTNEKEKED